MKKDLEQKLFEEQKKKNDFEVYYLLIQSKICTLEEAEVGFLKRMKNSQKEEDRTDVKYRSISTGMDSRVSSAKKVNTVSSNKQSMNV